ncbi:peptidoglycan bridge formation glycyltransferase FemA/FemB family protein [Syntrophobacter fumaroxidans]|uniref:BioF2-like acetyltransferase domain-containing protein n=1 Tax=Syntrophobacter fumaroxidans (strain DSM 10017 / MPOB) TaxID=335543 RepID=A0LNM0_SYNFM|nr:peptidoglycan bridge formation glycyltransferase FemA/FemB family protein [Syntrophobacter fumaroxidans]ABK19022.1 hypothetical protein Sfum_3349 [Syntrophobacter fumaroxidans MPOB]
MTIVLARYGDPDAKKLLAGIDERYPFPFLESYHNYLRDCRRGDPVLAFSEDGFSCIPLRMFRIRVFRFAELMFPPVHDGETLDAEKEADFISTLVTSLTRLKCCDRLIQPPPHCLFRSVPKGATACGFGSYVLQLEGRSEDDLFAGLHSDHRRKIRLAAKARLHVDFGFHRVNDFYALYSRTMQRSNMPHVSFSECARFHERLASSNNVLCGMVYHGESPLGGLLIPYTRQGAYYLYGASAEEVTVAGAIKLLHWETIRLLMHHGVKRYNFVGTRLSDVCGSKLEHIQRFKSRFGGVLETGYLWKMDLLRQRARIFDFLVGLRKKTSWNKHATARDIIDQERLKSETKTAAPHTLSPTQRNRAL